MAATVLVDPTAAVDGPPPPPESRARVLLVGTAFVTAAIAMLFIGLIAVYLALRTQALVDVGSWIPADVVLPLTQPNMMMLTLVLSMFTVQWAVSAIKNDDRAKDKLAGTLAGLKEGKVTEALAAEFKASGLTLPGDAKIAAD